MSANHQILVTQPGLIALQPTPIPTPADDELLIRTRVSLISPGTERAFFLSLPNTTDRYPQPLGYSNIGVVEAVGRAVTGWQVGDRVASNGYHAAYITVHAARCTPIPAALADEPAAFFNLASIALQGVRKARIELGEPVAVLGAGLIGLLALQLAKLQGGLPILSLDQAADRLPLALTSGADAALLTDDSLPAQMDAHTAGRGPAVVIEATGHPAAVLTALAVARPLGRVVLLGSTRGETDHVNFYRDIHKKGLTVLGAHNIVRPQHESSPAFWSEADDQRVTLDLLAHGRLTVAPYITHHFNWADAADAYELLRSWRRDALGLILDWTNHP